jgi:hypothetical protein
VIVGIDGSAGTDAGAEQVEEKNPGDRHPPPPSDRPGQEPEGVPSRLQARRALATKEEAAEKTAPTTDQNMPKSTSEQSDRGTEHQPGIAGEVDGGSEASGERRGGLRDGRVGTGAEGGAREADRQAASTPDAPAGQQPLERTDQPHEVKPPQIVRDYYPNIPPTAQDRYLARDQSNPVPIFDSSPNRDQAVQGRVGDCGIVATLCAVAEHRPEAIKEAIKQVGDGAYEITLHEITEAGPADPVARPTGEVKTYRVNDELPVRTDHPSRPPAGMQAESCGWPALMEKVIAAEDQTWDTAEKADWDHKWTAQHKPMVDLERAKAKLEPSRSDAPMGYNRLDIGSTPYQQAGLLAKLTGEEAEVRRIPGQQQGEQALLAAFGDQLGAGKPVLVGSRGRRVPTEQFPHKIVPGHAYEVKKVMVSFICIIRGAINIRTRWM